MDICNFANSEQKKMEKKSKDRKNSATVHTKKLACDSHFVMFFCGSKPVNFIHFPQDYFTGT